MAVTDIATRTYDHNWRLDPIVRSLLDTDFYKLLMLQMIRHLYPEVPVTFSVINRSHSVRLAEEIDEAELRGQSDHMDSYLGRMSGDTGLNPESVERRPE